MRNEPLDGRHFITFGRNEEGVAMPDCTGRHPHFSFVVAFSICAHFVLNATTFQPIQANCSQTSECEKGDVVKIESYRKTTSFSLYFCHAETTASASAGALYQDTGQVFC